MGARVSSIRTRLVPLPLATPITTPNYRIEAVWNLLVEVRDGDDVAGRGYLWCFGRDEAVMLREAIRVTASGLVGADPERPDDAMRQMRRRLNFFGFKGVVVFAMSALDLALVDLGLRQDGVSLSRRLHGIEVQPPRAYWSGLFLDSSVEELLAEVDDALALGLQAVKLRVGARELADDIRRVHAVREHLPDDAVLMLDAVQRWVPDEAITAARAFADAAPTWLEDPVVHSDYAGLARVVQHSPVPIASGENEYLSEGFDQLLETRLPYLLADLQRVGGITEWGRVQTRVSDSGAVLTSHTYPHVAAQLCAGAAESWVEYVPWWDVLMDHDLTFRNGRVVVRDEPGTGIAWDTAVIDELAAGPWEELVERS
ncbi:MAG: mandelate racemase/muconate lactonizing enzyme family protein [Nocardioides sp.]